MSVEAFDFRKPGRLPDFASSQLRQWQDDLARALGTSWQQQFGQPLEVLPKEFEVVSGAEVIQRYEENALVSHIHFGDDDVTRLCTSAKTAIRLVDGLLGDLGNSTDDDEESSEQEQTQEETSQQEPESEPESDADAGVDESPESEDAKVDETDLTGPPPRSLGKFDRTLLNSLMQEFSNSIDAALPEQLGIKTSTDALELWKEMVWTIAPERESIVLAFELSSPLKGCVVEWIVDASTIERLALKVTEKGEEAETSSELEHLVNELPVEVVVQLGTRQLEMRELSSLRPGDVLVLDQPINRPLTALIDGIPKYVGWPGKVGTRRAFQVSK